MALIHSRIKTKEKINLDQRAKCFGFRNFVSFAFINYYDKRLSPKECAKILNISVTRFRQELISRGWPVRSYKQASHPSPKKRKLHIKDKIKRHTNFSSTREALETLYLEYNLTTYQGAEVLHISQTSFLRLLKKYKIRRKKQGEEKPRSD